VKLLSVILKGLMYFVIPVLLAVVEVVGKAAQWEMPPVKIVVISAVLSGTLQGCINLLAYLNTGVADLKGGKGNP